MFSLSDFLDTIDQQLLHNRNKSLFYELANGRLAISPAKETIELLTQKAREISKFIRTAKTDGTFTYLLNYASDRSIKLFTEVNQYIDFSHENKRKLLSIYEEFFEQICTIGNNEEITVTEIDHLFALHFKKLQTFLYDTNGAEIFKKYRDNPALFEIKCAEYTPEFQIKLLNIELENVKEPVLDLGCGSQAGLVHFMRENGIEAYGMDRNVETGHYTFNMSWLECPFHPNIWGTVISHMAFSNHFTHHHLKADGEYKKYAHKYMEILHSLKLGGSFHYAPSLPFIEELLESTNNTFVIETKEHSTQIFRKME